MNIYKYSMVNISLHEQYTFFFSVALPVWLVEGLASGTGKGVLGTMGGAVTGGGRGGGGAEAMAVDLVVLPLRELCEELKESSAVSVAWNFE